MTEEKIRENRLRRAAERQGLRLVSLVAATRVPTTTGCTCSSTTPRGGRRGGQAAVSEFAKGNGCDLDEIEATLNMAGDS